MIPVNEPLLNGNEKKYLVECIESGWISSEGPYVKQLEEQLAKRVGRKFGVAVSNGSAALDAAVAALKLGPGDGVIMPAFTIISCAAAIVRAGATPVIIDADPFTWNMDLNILEDTVKNHLKTFRNTLKAIMAVHIYGLPVEMEPVLKIAEKYGLKVIEDAAEMIGQTCNGKQCGSFGDISTFSFYPNKHITTGEGGMIFTDDPYLAERCRNLRNLFFDKERRYIHEEIGWNLRMSNIQAALGVAQLERLDASLKRKREIGALYNKLLSTISNIQLPLLKTDYAENLYWVYGIVLNNTILFEAAEAMSRLQKVGIGTRHFFFPMNKQPCLQGLVEKMFCPVAERLAERGLYLPSGLGLTNDQIHIVADKVKEILS
jgi:perosamine synthetase